MTIGERVVPMGEGDALHGVVWGSGVRLRVTTLVWGKKGKDKDKISE